MSTYETQPQIYIPDTLAAYHTIEMPVASGVAASPFEQTSLVSRDSQGSLPTRGAFSEQTPLVGRGKESFYVDALARGFPEPPAAPSPAPAVRYPEATPMINEQRIDTESFYRQVEIHNDAIREIDYNNGFAAKESLAARALAQEVLGVIAGHMEASTVVRDELVAQAENTVGAYDESVQNANSLLRVQSDFAPEYEQASRAKQLADNNYNQAMKETVDRNAELRELEAHAAQKLGSFKAFIEDREARLGELHEYLYGQPTGDKQFTLTAEEHLEYIVKAMEIKVNGWDAGDYSGSKNAEARVHALLKEHFIPFWKGQLQELAQSYDRKLAAKQAECDKALEVQRRVLGAAIEERERFAKVTQKNQQLHTARQQALSKSSDTHALMEEIASQSERTVSPRPGVVLDALIYTLSQAREQIARNGDIDLSAIDVPHLLSHPALQPAADRPEDPSINALPQITYREGHVAVKGLLSRALDPFRASYQVEID
jgi:hypothetical protein